MYSVRPTFDGQPQKQRAFLDFDRFDNRWRFTRFQIGVHFTLKQPKKHPVLKDEILINLSAEINLRKCLILDVYYTITEYAFCEIIFCSVELITRE